MIFTCELSAIEEAEFLTETTGMTHVIVKDGQNMRVLQDSDSINKTLILERVKAV